MKITKVNKMTNLKVIAMIGQKMILSLFKHIDMRLATGGVVLRV